jgi:hypothetical protein
MASGELESLDDLEPSIEPGALQKYIGKLLDSLEGYIYTKNRIDLYNKEGIGLNIAIDEKDLEKYEDASDYLSKEFRNDGYSMTSKTRSADEYLKK